MERDKKKIERNKLSDLDKGGQMEGDWNVVFEQRHKQREGASLMNLWE